MATSDERTTKEVVKSIYDWEGEEPARVCALRNDITEATFYEWLAEWQAAERE